MKPEHDERFRRIADDYLDRPGGDYAELLRRGEVSSPEGVDPEQWRAEIRAKARADKIRVMTIRSGDRAIAALRRTVPKDQEFAVLSAAMERGEVLRGLPSGHGGWGTRSFAGSRTTRRASRCARAARPGSMSGSIPSLRSWTAKRSTSPAAADRAHRLSRNASSLSEGL